MSQKFKPDSIITLKKVIIQITAQYFINSPPKIDFFNFISFSSFALFPSGLFSLQKSRIITQDSSAGPLLQDLYHRFITLAFSRATQHWPQPHL